MNLIKMRIAVSIITILPTLIFSTLAPQSSSLSGTENDYYGIGSQKYQLSLLTNPKNVIYYCNYTITVKKIPEAMKTFESVQASAARRHFMNLVELLIVILIIAILLALIFSSLGTARAKGIQIQCFNHLREVSRGSMLYIGDYAMYPGFVNRRPYSDFLTGRTGAAAYLPEQVLRCTGFAAWRGRPYNRLRVYGIYEVNPADPEDATLDIRAGKFWDYRNGQYGEESVFYFGRLRNPSGVSFWRDSVIYDSTGEPAPHWKYQRDISSYSFGARLSHLRRSAGSYIDGHVEAKNLRELNEEPMKIRAAYSVSGEVQVLP